MNNHINNLKKKPTMNRMSTDSNLMRLYKNNEQLAGDLMQENTKNFKSHYQYNQKMNELLGNRFINRKGEEKSYEEVFNVKLVAILFSANWCSPCRHFDKELIELYEETNQGEKYFEIIEVCLDREEEEYKASLVQKIWYCLPFRDKKCDELIKHFNVQGIPSFFVLKPDTSILTKEGRVQLSKEGPDIIEKWFEEVGSKNSNTNDISLKKN